MSPSKQCGGQSLWHAAWAALLLMAATVTGCDQLTSTNGGMPEAGPDPSYRDVIASYLKDNFKDYTSYEAFEISAPRWVYAFQGWNWLTCVRFSDHGHSRTYALFLDGNTITSSRYAVQTDQCDMQAYTGFGQMGVGSALPPLH